VFTLYGTPGSLVYAVDGIQYKRLTPTDISGGRWAFDRPFFVVVNLAVGGKWAGSPDLSVVFPQRMLVDYVHVYAWDPDKMITK
jgi:beta-glucanase (GH16 family)